MESKLIKNGFNFSEGLLTGNLVIDRQHKEILRRAKTFYEICGRFSDGEETSASELTRALDFLCEFVVQHFDDEERISLKYNYPGYNAHCQKHAEFKRIAGTLRGQLDTIGVNSNLTMMINYKVATWLQEHIEKADTDLALYICEIKKKNRCNEKNNLFFQDPTAA